MQFVLTPTVPPVSDTLPEPAAAVGVPAHALVMFGVVATTIPLGRVSLNATPVRPTVFATGLVIVKVSVVVPFTPTPDPPKALLIVGGATTASEAVLLVAPVPPSVEVTAAVVLLTAPAAVPVTLTLIVHVPLAASVPLDKFNEVELVVAPPTVPLHVFVNAGEADTDSPAGSESAKATPLSELAVFGFARVKVNDVEPFSGTLDAPKALLIVGGATTVRVAVLLTAPFPLCVEETTPVVLGLAPAVVPVTFKLKVQLLLVATAPPVNETLPELVAGVPPQVFTILGVAATTKPAGRASVNATPVRAAGFAAGFVMVKVKEVVPPIGIAEAPKPLLIVGGAATLRVAVLLARPVPPLVELTLPVVFGNTPAVAAVTFTLSVQLPAAATVPPVKEMLPEPAAAVGVPAHVFVIFGVEATTIPVGKVSVKAMPVWDTVLAAGLAIVKVSEVDAPTPMPFAPNALLIVGDETIEIVGLAL